MPSAATIRGGGVHERDTADDFISVTSSDASSRSSSESDSSSDDSSESESDSDESVSSEYLNGLLAAARKNMSEKAMGKQKEDSSNIIMLGSGERSENK